MFESFSERAIKVIMLAQEEARRLGHNFVGTEQILLGLVHENNGVASKVLLSIGLNLRDARYEVEKIIGRGSGFVAVEIPFTPRAKKILEFSLHAAKLLDDNYIGTEHLLLGLIEEGQGVAARVLENLGLDLSLIKEKVFLAIGKSYQHSKFEQGYEENNENLSIEENEIFKNLQKLGIKKIEQLNNKDVFYWWQKKYLEISKSESVDQNELLIELNDAKEKLETLKKESLINVFEKRGVKRNSSINYGELGDEKYDLGEFDEAIELFNLAIEQDPSNAFNFHSRGAAKDSLGKYKEAIKDYNKAIKIDPYHADFFNSRAATRAKLSQFSSAITDINKAIKLEPSNITYKQSKTYLVNLQKKKAEEKRKAEKRKKQQRNKN